MAWWKENSITCVCLDIDGTLYPRSILNRKMLATLFPHAVTALRYMRMRKLFRQRQETEITEPATLEGFRRRQAVLVLGEGIPSSSLSPHRLEALEQDFEKYIYGRWIRSYRKVKPFPHVHRALERIHELGMQIGVMSDFPVGDKIRTLGLEDFVGVAVSSEASGYLKPHPATFAYLLDHMGNPNPSAVLYVGDSYDKDIVGAHKSGMKTCLIVEKKHITDKDRALWPLADIICTSWADFSRQFF